MPNTAEENAIADQEHATASHMCDTDDAVVAKNMQTLDKNTPLLQKARKSGQEHAVVTMVTKQKHVWEYHVPRS
jgi:hypothetical protein